MLTVAAQMFIAVWKQNAAEDLLAKKRRLWEHYGGIKQKCHQNLQKPWDENYILKRKKCVLLLSTMHHDDAVNEDQERKADIVLFYNETKSGVDTLDQPVLEYTCKQRTGGGQWFYGSLL
ncbi:hypothetical protein T08_15728 [Trichinella sp. T8]|nr:hypothetical protein T08_15728 [Trichinella sp. T8]